jgi:hypothetical protein
MSVAGVGARIGAGQTYVPEWTRPGPTCRWSELRVDREPARDGALWGSPQPEPLTSGRGRLSPRTLWGAARRQGPGSSPRGSTRLDLDGWLVRFDTDTCPSERPAAHHRPTDKILALGPPPRWRSSPRPGKTHPLDTSLLMGGTFGLRQTSRGGVSTMAKVVDATATRPPVAATSATIRVNRVSWVRRRTL